MPKICWTEKTSHRGTTPIFIRIKIEVGILFKLPADTINSDKTLHGQ